jgi:pSer/pThr/pTyr-binding forkhead associated (FHA) protein
MASRAATPRLTAVNGQEFTLTQPIMTIGRGEAATIQINEPGASRVHCEVILGSQTLVRDLGSTNGTVVDGVRVVEGILKEGSIIRIGDTTLTYTSR